MFQRLTGGIACAALALILAACGSSSSSSSSTPAPATTYSVGGSITGLGNNTGLVLLNNGGDNLAVAANATTFTFATKLANAANYAVTVPASPAAVSCSVTANGSGTIAAANVTNVAITCTPSGAATYSVGGSITGLGNNSGLVLYNNANSAGDAIAVAANATSFTFTAQLAAGAAYAVAVHASPAGLTCSVTANGSGSMGAANVTNVAVTCSASSASYTVGGNIAGLTGAGLMLELNSTQSVTPASGDTSYTFPTGVANGLGYSVTLITNPAGENCLLSNTTGTIAAANVTNVNVACGTPVHIGGTITGLPSPGVTPGAGAGLVLTLTINGSIIGFTPPNPGATTFQFGQIVIPGVSYQVAVSTQPGGATCTTDSTASGTTASLDITNVAVTCTPNTGGSALTSFNSGSLVPGAVDAGGLTNPTTSDIGFAIAGDRHSHLLVAGVTALNAAVWRYNLDGSPDTSWGNSSTSVAYAYVKGDMCGATSIAKALTVASYTNLLVPDDAIVLGIADGATVFITRLLQTGGALDTSFGTGSTGFVCISGFDSSNPFEHALALDNSNGPTKGSILVSGTASGLPVLKRYTTAGVLDSTFGSGGTFTLTLPPAFQVGVINAILIEPTNGTIYVGGSLRQTSIAATKYMMVTAIQPNGEGLLSGFATAQSGFFFTGGTAGGTLSHINDEVRSLAFGHGSFPAGTLVAAGISSDNANANMAVWVFNSNGQLMNSTNAPGTPFNGTKGYFTIKGVAGLASSDEARAVIVQPTGEVVIGGGSYDASSEPHGALVRLKTDGTLDNTFGVHGALSLPRVSSFVGGGDIVNGLWWDNLNSTIFTTGIGTPTSGYYDMTIFAIKP